MQLYASEHAFTYKYNYRKTQFELDLYQISKSYLSRGFESLTIFPRGNITGLFVDDVLSSKTSNGIIFIKLGLIAPKEYQNKLLTKGDMTLFHTAKGTIAFYRFDRSEIYKILKNEPRTQISWHKILNLIIPVATASDGGPCVGCKQRPFAELENINNKVNTQELLSKAGQCIMDGLQERTESFYNSIANFQNMLSSPWELWDKIKENYLLVESLLKNLSTNISELAGLIPTLNIEDQVEIACILIPDLTEKLVLTLTGVGTTIGVTQLISQTLPKLSRLKNYLLKIKDNPNSKKYGLQGLRCEI